MTPSRRSVERCETAGQGPCRLCALRQENTKPKRFPAPGATPERAMRRIPRSACSSPWKTMILLHPRRRTSTRRRPLPWLPAAHKHAEDTCLRRVVTISTATGLILSIKVCQEIGVVEKKGWTHESEPSGEPCHDIPPLSHIGVCTTSWRACSRRVPLRGIDQRAVAPTELQQRSRGYHNEVGRLL